MEKWVLKNREAFERDVLQDYCLVSDQLFEQFSRFDAARTISFPVLRALVGEPLNKGLLWRLKDKAHHIFRGEPEEHAAGWLLDWTLGYVFHEALKLMEDAYQRQHYAPRLMEIEAAAFSPELADMKYSLFRIQEGTSESMRREIVRLTELLYNSRRLFILYFTGKAGHRPLARFLNDNEALVRRIFQEDYPFFVAAVYGDEPERMYIEAAHSLLESVRKQAAGEAVLAALSINPANRAAVLLREAHGW
jgi:hypothetical protein